MRFSRELVEKLNSNAVDFVIDIETSSVSKFHPPELESRLPLNICSVVLHNDIDEIIDGRWAFSE
jgi:hypothetical protein